MQKRIAIIGANGQIGRELASVLNEYELVLLTRKDFDVTDYDSTRKKVNEINPEIIINTSAFHKVDECEKDVEKSFAVNAFSIRNLADICREKEITLVNFSTDYVFDGNKESPYTEDDKPSPLNVYGLSKLAGEYFVRSLEKYFLIRTAYVFGISKSSQKRTNLVETLLEAGKKGEIKVVHDNCFSPTYARDLANVVGQLLETEKYGIYHITNNGSCSVYDLALKIFEFEKLSPTIGKISLEDVNKSANKAKRPVYSALTSINLKKAGIPSLRNWEEALESYLAERRKI